MNITMIGKSTIARMALGMLCLVFLGWAQGVAAAKDVPPKVKLTSPANHAVFAAPATITLEASASDKDGTIKKVQFFNGSKKLATVTSAPYTFTWTNVKAGKFTLTAVATDNRGAKTTSHEVHIIVDITPAASLTSPANNATFKAPATIPLMATAKDPDGKIAKVDFFQGTSLLATVTTRPYTFTLNGVQAGNYSLTARATDNRGLTTTSSAINITVTSGAAQLFYIYTDQLNTPRAITNQQNQIVWRWDNQDPFGGNIPDEDPDGDGIRFTCNLRFPGQYFDRETNLAYNYFRDYDPSIGRYVQSDPIGLDGGLNTYAFTGQNPINFVDVRGLIDPRNRKPFTGPIGPPNYCGSGTTVPNMSFALASFGASFNDACKNHDDCYDCGPDKETCDRNFQKDLHKACAQTRLGSTDRFLCNQEADFYYWNVKTFADRAFRNAQAQAKAQKKCLSCN